MDTKSTDWRAGPNVCRCCLTEGCYKDISTEYFWMGKREVYAEMLSDTLNLTIAYSQSGGPNSHSRLICELCISRLRDASDFRRQVVECEKTFIQHLDASGSSELEVLVEPIDSSVKLEQVKQEKRVSDDDFDDRIDFDDDDDDDLDDQPLTTLASKIPKKESEELLELLDTTKPAEKRKSTSKTKASPAKKSKTVKKDTVKATASKVAAKGEKKKKEPHVTPKTNAEVVLQYSTLYPFRMQGKALICVFCCEEYEDPAVFRCHVDTYHAIFSVSTAFAHMNNAKDYLKVDCTNLKCRLCSEPFENIQDIAEHLQKFHLNKVTKQLDLSYDIGLQPYRLEKDNYTCFNCGTKLPTLMKLCRHTTLHYKQYTCDICGRTYLTNEALKYHIRCNHSGQHVCRKCWKDFPTLEKKRDHVRKSKPCWSFCCVYCGERFQSWEFKQKHLEQEHGFKKVTYPCPECNITFKTRKYFYNHYKIQHTDEGLQCSCCGLKFGSKTQLDDHVLAHTGEKQFKCSVCGKCFSRNKTLRQHMWIHSETKRFVCLICEKQFAQKISLKAHMKGHHPDVEIGL